MRFTIAHLFCGIGGKALGAAAAVATHGEAQAMELSNGAASSVHTAHPEEVP